VDIAAVGDIAPTLKALLPQIQVRGHGGFLVMAVSRASEALIALEKRAVVDAWRSTDREARTLRTSGTEKKVHVSCKLCSTVSILASQTS
jgi:hypothetical protein